jgi:hypothetical protein
VRQSGPHQSRARGKAPNWALTRGTPSPKSRYVMAEKERRQANAGRTVFFKPSGSSRLA